MLDKEGAAGPADVAILGDEETVRAGIQRYADIGVTDFHAAVGGTITGQSDARTLDVLKTLPLVLGRIQARRTSSQCTEILRGQVETEVLAQDGAEVGGVDRRCRARSVGAALLERRGR